MIQVHILLWELTRIFPSLEIMKTLVLLYLNVIEWMTQRIDHKGRTILNFKEKHVASYQALVVNQLYHFKES